MLTCVENVDVDLPQGLIVLPGAVATKGIDLVPHSHGRVVHPPWPTFQVHCPPEHSSLQARRSSGPPVPQPHASQATATSAASATQPRWQNNKIHPEGLPIFLECLLQRLPECILVHLPPDWKCSLRKGTRNRAQRSKQRCPGTQNPSGWLHRQPQPSTFSLAMHTSRTCHSHLSA